jgi:hypothetical protein
VGRLMSELGLSGMVHILPASRYSSGQETTKLWAVPFVVLGGHRLLTSKGRKSGRGWIRLRDAE